MKGMQRQPMSVAQPLYRLREITMYHVARLPCTYITDISLEIWKRRYIIQLSISPQSTCNCALVTHVFETELFLPYFIMKIERIFVHIACH